MERTYSFVLMGFLLFTAICFTQLACGFKQTAKVKRNQQEVSEKENTMQDSQITNANKIATDTKIRYVETYESVCCPRDYKHDNHLLNYIENFEKNNNVHLSSSYKLPLGKEGEAAYFLSLDKLTFSMQKKFIQNRLKLLKSNDKSVASYLEKPITVNKALKKWDNISTNRLIKF